MHVKLIFHQGTLFPITLSFIYYCKQMLEVRRLKCLAQERWTSNLLVMGQPTLISNYWCWSIKRLILCQHIFLIACALSHSSSAPNLLFVLRTKLKVEETAFSLLVPTKWNALHSNTKSAPTLSSFKNADSKPICSECLFNVSWWRFYVWNVQHEFCLCCFAISLYFILNKPQCLFWYNWTMNC